MPIVEVMVSREQQAGRMSGTEQVNKGKGGQRKISRVEIVWWLLVIS